MEVAKRAVRSRNKLDVGYAVLLEAGEAVLVRHSGEATSPEFRRKIEQLRAAIVAVKGE